MKEKTYTPEEFLALLTQDVEEEAEILRHNLRQKKLHTHQLHHV